MRHEEIYNNVRVVLGTFLLFAMFMTPSCEDDKLPEPQENILMYVNGSEIVPREYYESVTTYGASSVQEDGSIKKIFVVHFQKEFALIMYDNNGADNGQLIDEKIYIGGTNADSLLLESTSGRVTLEIVGLSDYTEFGQGSITKYEDGKVDGMVDGYFYNPYADIMQHGIIIFENLEIGTDPEATFYQGVY